MLAKNLHNWRILTAVLLSGAPLVFWQNCAGDGVKFAGTAPSIPIEDSNDNPKSDRQNDQVSGAPDLIEEELPLPVENGVGDSEEIPVVVEPMPGAESLPAQASPLAEVSEPQASEPTPVAAEDSSPVNSETVPEASAGGVTDIAAADSAETDGESEERAESEDEDLAISLGAACKAKASDVRLWVQFYVVDHQGQRVPLVADGQPVSLNRLRTTGVVVRPAANVAVRRIGFEISSWGHGLVDEKGQVHPLQLGKNLKLERNIALRKGRRLSLIGDQPYALTAAARPVLRMKKGDCRFRPGWRSFSIRPADL